MSMNSKLAGYLTNFVKLFPFLASVLFYGYFFLWLTRSRDGYLHRKLLTSPRGYVCFFHLVKHDMMLYVFFLSLPRVDLLVSTKSPICQLIKFMLWKLYQRLNSQSPPTNTIRLVSVNKRVDFHCCSNLWSSWFLAPQSYFEWTWLEILRLGMGMGGGEGRAGLG